MINFKGYNLDYFKEKDLYTIDETIAIIEDMECTIHNLQEQLEDLQQEKEEPDRYEDYRLGLI